MTRLERGTSLLVWPLLLAAAALSLQCAGKNRGEPPPWMEEGAPVMDQENFYGRGCAPAKITSRAFKIATARERARVDLAEKVYQYCLQQLEGDTTAARKAVETALPDYKVIDSYLDQQGSLCARAGLPKQRVEEELIKRGKEQ